MYEIIFYNSKLQKLITFSWYVADDLVVSFSRNLEEWNLSLKLPGGFPLG